MKKTLLCMALCAAMVLPLAACGPMATKPGDPGGSSWTTMTPAQFCADAKAVDLAANELHLSAKGQKTLSEAEAVIWPSGTTGCNENPLPAKWDDSIVLPMAVAAANLLIAETQK